MIIKLSNSHEFPNKKNSKSTLKPAAETIHSDLSLDKHVRCFTEQSEKSKSLPQTAGNLDENWWELVKAQRDIFVVL